ncbi:MAG: hypothetical protein L0191_11670 [Acidobacteria bacterium]|nr:hypothetical protein [Acidobacteriota bacterium]
MIRSLGALLFVLILTACTTQSGTQLPEAEIFVQAGQQFGLRVGETAGVLTSQAIALVRFNGVTQDSRCPLDVQCITAGSATVLLSVQTALSVQDVTMEVPPEGTVELVVDELTVTAIGVRPNAQQGVTIDPLDYIVGLRVTESSTVPIPS